MAMKRKTAGAAHALQIDETKEHVLAAGREILLAAQGALRFCRDYAETQASPAARVQLVKFFSKAIAVADELGGSLVRASSLGKAASSVTRPLFEAMSREMRRDERLQRREWPTTQKRAAARKRTRARTKRRAARGA